MARAGSDSLGVRGVEDGRCGGVEETVAGLVEERSRSRAKGGSRGKLSYGMESAEGGHCGLWWFLLEK